MTTNTERTRAIIDFLRDYAERRMRSHLWDERRSFPPHVVLDLARAGLFATNVPTEYGGHPLSTLEGLAIVEQLAAIDTTLASFVGVNEGLGTRPLVRFGSERAKERYLPELAQGRLLAGLALTEPAAGSDPRAIASRGERIGPDTYHLHGTKSWIGNASWGGLIHAFVRVAQSGDQPTEFVGFCVPSDQPGVVHGPEALTMGMRAMVQNEVRLEGVEVHESDRLGVPGHGIDPLLDTLNFGRIGIAAMALGAMQRSIQLLCRYASRRRIASGRLLDHPDVLAFFSRAAGSIEMARQLTRFIGSALDRGETIDDAWYMTAKIVVPELAFEIVDGAMQRLGGRGYIEANGVPQLFRDVRLFRIFEGPTEALASHLGARVMADPEPIASLLRSLDGDPPAAFLIEHASSARERLLARDLSPLERRQRAQRLGLMLGHWTAFALVESLCGKSLAHGAALARERRRRAQRRLAKVLRDRVAPFDADDVEALMHSVRASIGDVEQLAASEDHLLDPLLRREC